MSSPMDICNLALSEAGARETIAAFDEGSVAATQCSLWYDRLRKMLLRSAPWGFARGQADLSQLGSLAEQTSPLPWPYKYTFVPDALRVRYILPRLIQADGVPFTGTALGYCVPSRANRFVIGNDIGTGNIQRKVILTTVQYAQAVYVRDVTDVDLFDDSFFLALASLLAYKLVIPLSGNAGMRPELKQSASDAITSARAADGNEAIPTSDSTPDWISVRGSGDYGALGDIFAGLGNWYVGWDNLDWGS